MTEAQKFKERLRRGVSPFALAATIPQILGHVTPKMRERCLAGAGLALGLLIPDKDKQGRAFLRYLTAEEREEMQQGK